MQQMHALSDIHGQILTIGEWALAGAIAPLQTLKLYQKEYLAQNTKMGDRRKPLQRKLEQAIA